MAHLNFNIRGKALKCEISTKLFTTIYHILTPVQCDQKKITKCQ